MTYHTIPPIKTAINAHRIIRKPDKAANTIRKDKARSILQKIFVFRFTSIRCSSIGSNIYRKLNKRSSTRRFRLVNKDSFSIVELLFYSSDKQSLLKQIPYIRIYTFLFSCFYHFLSDVSHLGSKNVRGEHFYRIIIFHYSSIIGTTGSSKLTFAFV